MAASLTFQRCPGILFRPPMRLSLILFLNALEGPVLDLKGGCQTLTESGPRGSCALKSPAELVTFPDGGGACIHWDASATSMIYVTMSILNSIAWIISFQGQHISKLGITLLVLIKLCSWPLLLAYSFAPSSIFFIIATDHNKSPLETVYVSKIHGMYRKCCMLYKTNKYTLMFYLQPIDFNNLLFWEACNRQILLNKILGK